MKILGIETSCDETAAAVVEDGQTILSNVIASQVEMHARYGGIVPEIASRQHLLSAVPVLQKALSDAGVKWSDLQGVAVTYGPGLAGSLLVGVNMAKGVALAHDLPLTGVNHLEAHIYANWLAADTTPEFPNLSLIVSGGHTELVLMLGHGQLHKLGQTRDDAAGEAFDKAARILGLGYPGGVAIEKAAESGKPVVSLPRAWLKGTDDFSFSGLKTALLHKVRDNGDPAGFSVADAAASFQWAAVEALVTKTIDVARRLSVRQILLSGGVTANKALRERFLKSSVIPVLMPPTNLCTDNAAMVAACGYYQFGRGQVAGYDLDVVPGLGLSS